MASVQYQGDGQSVLPDTRAPDDYSHVQASPDMFGGPIARGLDQLGQGVSRAQQFYGQVAVDDQINKLIAGADRIQRGDPNGVATSPDGQPIIGPDGKPQQDLGYYGLRGEDAMRARPNAEAQLDQIIVAGRQNLSTPEQQLEYDSQSRRLRSAWANGIGQHAETQANAWMDGVNEAGAAAARQHIAANATNPAEMQNGVEDLINMRVKQAQHRYGMDPTVTNQAMQSARAEAAATRVEALQNTDPLQAKVVLEANRTLLPPAQYDQLVTRLRPMIAGVSAPEAISRASNGVGPVTADQVHASIIGQESGGRPDAATSVTGAKGIGQIQPATFQQYARPGESINSPADNLAVSRRITDDYYRRFGGDPARVAVAYFSGPGNVAPAGRPTPYLQNRADPTGKTTASYVSDVTRRLGRGGGQPLPTFAGPGMTSPSSLPSTPSLISQAGPAPAPQPASAPGADSPPTTLPAAPAPPAGSPTNLDDDAAGLPDKGMALKHAADMAGDDPIQRRMNIAEVNRRYAEQMYLTQTERSELMQRIPDLMAAASAGVDGVTLPEQNIRRLLPPAKAEQIIGEFHANAAVGSLMRGVQWSSLQQVEEIQRDISSGQGVYSDALRVHHNAPTTGAGTTGAAEDGGDVSYFKRREVAARQINSEIQRRNSLLVGPESDPAAYVANNPTVRQAAANIDPKNPASFDSYATASLGMQNFLGAPEGQQHVLSRGQAQSVSQQIMASTDPKATFASLQTQYGAAWQNVFKDAVSLGRLPATYQAVQTLEDPHDAALLSRALATEKAGPDGKPAKSMDDIVDLLATKGEAGRIRDAVRTSPDVQSYVASFRRSGASPDQIMGVVNSVETLGLAKRAAGEAPDSASAAAAATKSFFGKFDYLPNGGARVPAKNFDAVSANARATLDGLATDHIIVPPIFGQTGQPEQQEYVDTLKAAPTWITSPKNDAIWLMDNRARFVRGRDGRPVSVPFNLPAPVAPTAERSVADTIGGP